MMIDCRKITEADNAAVAALVRDNLKALGVDIPGTEDLMPYVNRKAGTRKWVVSLIMFPVLVGIIAGVMQVIG